ncbi:hypothetical protein G5C65_32780, partial [Streptomyces sp. SB3404]|nr:hypothetical protein [Streptomyces boncukensis]
MTTQNGRGQDGAPGSPGDAELPAATTPYEGVVLPAHGDQWAPQPQHTQPPAGQPWGQPWGPGSEAALQAGERPASPELSAPYEQGAPPPQPLPPCLL